MKKLNEIHDCEKCHGKIVMMSIDALGVTRCGYCNEVVDYSNYFRYKEAEKVIKQLKKKEFSS